MVTGIAGTSERILGTGVGTGAFVVQPAASNPTNNTAQARNSKDLISHNIAIGNY
jgi:hypothetical protein